MATAPRPSLGLRGKGYRVALYGMLYKFVLKYTRAVEWMGGPMALLLIVGPYFLCDLVYRRRDYPRFCRLHDLHPKEFWKGISPWRHYLRMIWQWIQSGASIICYPSLGQDRWQKRFTIVGATEEDLARWSKRPVILATLHVGPFALLPYWLRSQKIPAGTVLGGVPEIIENEEFQRIKDLGDARYGLQGVPHTFARQGPAVRDAIRFLVPGHVLTMAIDGGKLIPEDQFDVGGSRFFAKQGASRFAAQAGALLIPVSIVCTGFIRFKVQYGTPVPDELLRKEDYRGATEHLVTELWKHIREAPSQMNWTALEACAPELRGKRVNWP